MLRRGEGQTAVEFFAEDFRLEALQSGALAGSEVERELGRERLCGSRGGGGGGAHGDEGRGEDADHGGLHGGGVGWLVGWLVCVSVSASEWLVRWKSRRGQPVFILHFHRACLHRGSR